MTDTYTHASSLDLKRTLTRIRWSNAETEWFTAEARKLARDVAAIPYAALFSGLIAGAALFGVGIAYAKVFGGP